MTTRSKAVKYIVILALGIIYLAATIWGYKGIINIINMREFELTFVSNTLVGILFVVAGIKYFISKKELPSILFLSAAVMLMLVFLTCMAFITTMNFRGGFIFLHIINPITALLTYIFLIEQKPLKRRIYMLGIIAFLILYLVYAIVYGFSSGNWLYGFLNIPKKGVGFVALFTVIAAAGVFLMEIGLYYLNIAVHKHLLRHQG